MTGRLVKAVLTKLVPNQGGVLWVAVLSTFLTFGDFRRLRSKRNGVLCALLLMAPLFLDLVHWNGWPAAVLFALIYVLTAGYAVWALVLGLRGSSVDWVPNPGKLGLGVLVGFLVLLNVVIVLGRPPDDAGYYTNLGARRWTETGVLPYGDPQLKGPDSPAHGAAATYGPLLYASHIPFQWLTGAHRNPAGLDPKAPAYVPPPELATQLTCLTFHLIGLLALYRVVSHLAGAAIGLGAVALYAGSPYVLGLGGEVYLAGGLVYISHIAPTAVTLIAFLALDRPWASGALLAAASGLLYYPAFFFPLWLGWYVWRRRGALEFAGGFVLSGLMIAAIVIMFTPAVEGESAVTLFLESTLEHQEGTDPDEYGLSKFGFWGNFPRLAAFWQTPLFGSHSLLKPAFVLFAALCAGAFFLARGRSLPQLAALTAMLAAAVQLWKSHAAGTYVEWYYPFLLIALLGGRPSPPHGREEEVRDLV